MTQENSEPHQKIWENLQLLSQLQPEQTISIVSGTYVPVVYNSWYTAFYRWHNGDDRHHMLSHIKNTLVQALQQISAGLVPTSSLSQVEAALGGLEILLETYREKRGTETEMVARGEKILRQIRQRIRNFNLSSASYSQGLQQPLNRSSSDSHLESSTFLLSLSHDELRSRVCSAPHPEMGNGTEETSEGEEVEYFLDSDSLSGEEGGEEGEEDEKRDEEENEEREKGKEEELDDSSFLEGRPPTPRPSASPNLGSPATEEVSARLPEPGNQEGKDSKMSWYRRWPRQRQRSQLKKETPPPDSEETNAEGRLILRSEPESEFIRQCCLIS
jgi:hypothetical protein